MADMLYDHPLLILSSRRMLPRQRQGDRDTALSLAPRVPTSLSPAREGGGREGGGTRRMEGVRITCLPWLLEKPQDYLYYSIRSPSPCSPIPDVAVEQHDDTLIGRTVHSASNTSPV